MFTLTSVGTNIVAMGFNGGAFNSDGSLNTTIYTANGTDVGVFSVVVVSTSSPGAAAAAGVTSTAALPAIQFPIPSSQP